METYTRCAFSPVHLGRLLCVLILATAMMAMPSASFAQSIEQMAKMAEQAEILAVAPRLEIGETAFSAEALADGQLAWIEVQLDGLYTLSVSQPGALILASFPTQDGRYDGRTKSVQHALAKSHKSPLSLGPILLSRAHPYLISVSGQAAANVTFALEEPLETIIDIPVSGTPVTPGTIVYQATSALTSKLPDSHPLLNIQILAEPRATLDARVSNQSVSSVGLYPWAPDSAAKVYIAASVAGGPPPLVLLRISEFDGELDEAEPNHANPNPIDVNAPFKGVLLPGADKDALAFSLATAQYLALQIESTLPQARFVVTLQSSEGNKTRLLWKRQPSSASLTSESLALPPGDYRLELKRVDRGKAAAPYVVSWKPASAPGANQEVEPNDSVAMAMPLPDSLRVRGFGASDDNDVFRFSVPDEKPDHLWRVFTVDAKRIQVEGKKGKIADVAATGKRLMADALALLPGDYTVTVSGEGEYLLRVMDLGSRPSDYEGEPNDSVKTGQRLGFGEPVRGGFHAKNDIDYYLFRLDTASAVEILIRPASDGQMDVKLFQGSHQIGDRSLFDPGDGPYHFRSNLPAGDWALQFRALEETITETYEVGVRKLAPLAGNEPDDDPLMAAKLPRDGDITDSVGAFDKADQVFVPLPRGEGTAAIVCAKDSDSSTGRWRVFNWSDDSSLGDIREGIVIFNYDPQLGGAVRLGLSGTTKKIGYDCSMRFAAQQPPPAGRVVPIGEQVTLLAPGETLRTTIAADGPEPKFTLGIDEGRVGFVSCRDQTGVVLAEDTRVWRLEGVSTPVKATLGDYRPFVARTEPVLVLQRSYAKRHGGELPMDVECTLFTAGNLARPADMGPPAEFRIITPADTGGADTAVVDSGPPPPGIEALLAREVPDSQPKGDLPVTIEPDALPQLAGYAEAGQRFLVSAKLTNDSIATLSINVDIGVAGDGWRVSPETQSKTLAAGKSATITADIIAPPWLSPVLKPVLTLKAVSGDAFSALVREIPVASGAIPTNPVTYWHAPDALRAGLNVLHYGLGARLEEMGGKVLDEKQQKFESPLHDGLAPHIASNNVAKELVFRLAARSELAGAMVQLRSTTGAESWPAEVEFFISNEEGGWRRVGASALRSIHAPQYIVFEEPVTAERLRVRFPRCNAKCNQVYVQELQAIAVPGTHPAGLPPINAAELYLGGHVVHSSARLGGGWNEQFLVAIPEKSNGGWSIRDRKAVVVVGFHHNRAALLQAVVWVGDPDDEKRILHATVDASITGPGGPWTELGRLPAPPIGETRSEWLFDEPVWARYLRLSFDISGESNELGPDGFEAIEATGSSVLGLWEDDQPRAAYEAAINVPPPAPVPPAGGAGRDSAVALPVGVAIASSVVIEKNEDWWRLTIPDGPPQLAKFQFERERPVVVAELSDASGQMVPWESAGGEGRLEAVLVPGDYRLRIFEPPRSVVISWDTSGSVAQYIPRTLAAVRTWGRSLKPGRDALQLLPFGPEGFLLEDWAETPEVLEPALRALPEKYSSDSEEAMLIASEALADRDGARGIVIMTDAETGMETRLWPALLKAMPRVVSLSVDSNSRQNAAIMMDWAALNGGRFQRVIGPLGLADGMDMANALFRAPKAYQLTARLEELIEPEGEATLSIEPDSAFGSAATGAVELILDASGSMLQRMEGRRRIDIAHDALEQLVRETLPEGTPFAFRAFGLEEDACRTELIVSLGPLDRESAAEAITGVPAINLARTAIADSLLAAGQDLAGSQPPRVIVLVTDGEETCEGDPEAAIAELLETGLDARINIVGFAIDDAALAETFSTWADAGGGTYFDARGASALETAIADALTPRFRIVRTFLDGRQETVGHAALGETVTVPAGRLTIAPGSAAIGGSVTVQAAPGASLSLRYGPEAGLGLDGAGDDSE